MKNTLSYTTLVVTLLVGVYFSSVGMISEESSQSDIVLPVEVMHYDVFGEHAGNDELPSYGGNSPRYVKEVTFDVSGDPGELWLWAHHIGFQYFWDNFNWQGGSGDVIGGTGVESSYEAPYDDRAKAAIRINGGAWVDITNDNVTCAAVEESEFCIGGVAAATRFKVNGSQLEQGSNTVEFAFLGHGMLSSGYRILDIAALPAGYDGSLSHREVEDVDLITNNKVMNYLDKDPPAGAEAQAGATLWHERNSLVDFPGGPEIIASCNDCHAQDGRDLEFFGYSNESITVRSMHHGLTEQEGENIAAYIRSQDLTLEDGTSYSWRSRPWHPPYQPGPRGFGPNDEHPDVADAQFWSAGAGLEWVADDEDTLFPYLFPDGTANHDAGPFEEPGGISVRSEYFDTHGEIMNLREIPLSSQLPDWNRWLPIIHPLDVLGEAAMDPSNNDAMAQYESCRSTPTNCSLGNFDFRARNNIVRPSRDADLEEGDFVGFNSGTGSRRRRGAQQFLAVKMWELQHEFYFEDRTGNEEPRYWNNGRTTFDIASHISGDQSTQDGPPVGKAGGSLSHLWYQLQVIQSGVMGIGRMGQNPIDVNYQKMFERSYAKRTERPIPTRATAFGIKHSQFRRYNKSFTGLLEAYTQHRSGLRSAVYYINRDLYGDVDPDLRLKIMDQWLSSWIERMTRWDIGQFPRGANDRDLWGTLDERPRVRSVTPHGTNQANNHYNSMRLFDANYDISATTIDSIATWGSQMWGEPQEDSPAWDTWFLENVADFSLSMQAPENTVEPVSVTLSVDPSGSPDEVRFYQDESLVATLTEAPYEHDIIGLVAGEYTFRAESETNGTVETSGNRFTSVSQSWNRDRLEGRGRGNVTGQIEFLPDVISMQAGGADAGVRSKSNPQQYESTDSCRLEDEFEFSVVDIVNQPSVWTRVGVQIENTGNYANADPDVDPITGKGSEMWAIEYLPRQNRTRVVYSEPDREGVRTKQSFSNMTLPFSGRVSIEDAGAVHQIRVSYDTNGDGDYDTTFTDNLETFTDDCSISVTASSRTGNEQTEVLFTLEKIE